MESRLIQLLTNKYMEKIGFGNQPYVVYGHNDAALLLFILSQQIFKPMAAESPCIILGRISHKKQERKLKENIGNQTIDFKCIDESDFRIQFTSLSTLNAVLKLYNVTADRVTADRGEKDSRIYKNNRLLQDT
jgi:hypothetical protein